VTAAPEGLQLARVATLSEGIAALQAVREGRPPVSC
jgi:PDZ domain-containing protein